MNDHHTTKVAGIREVEQVHLRQDTHYERSSAHS